MVIIKRLKYIFCVALIATSALRGDIIFDLGGVLIDTDSLSSLRSIGLKNIITSMIQLKKGPFSIKKHLKHKLFLTLACAAQECGYTTAHVAYDEDGDALPAFMCAWLAGTITCSDIKNYTLTFISQNPTFFASNGEKQAIENMVTMIFTPEKFVQTRKVYSKSIRFITACKKRGHRIYCLSNWDAESFTLLKTKYASLFDLFDGIVISGEVNALKPSPNIYDALIARYNLDINNCWFIDDQKENIAAAQERGITGILCEHTGPIKKPNYQKAALLIHDGHKSVTRREKRNKSGAPANIISNTSNPMMVGENIS